jgi:hypothetical protein
MEGGVMAPARPSGRRVVSRRSFIVGGGVAAAALALLAIPRWDAMQRRRGIYSDTYSDSY